MSVYNAGMEEREPERRQPQNWDLLGKRFSREDLRKGETLVGYYDWLRENGDNASEIVHEFRKSPIDAVTLAMAKQLYGSQLRTFAESDAHIDEIFEKRPERRKTIEERILHWQKKNWQPVIDRSQIFPRQPSIDNPDEFNEVITTLSSQIQLRKTDLITLLVRYEKISGLQ